MTTRDIASTGSMRVAAARDVLVGLGEVTAGGDPYALVPQRWIDELHDVLGLIATREGQRRYRLEGVLGITMRRLHRHVEAFLHDFDGLVDDNLRLTKQAR